jgi:flagellar basal-body rod protein FlgB
MDLDAIPLFKLMSKRMDWLNQRQAVVAENVANVDTPGFKPSDLTPFSFRDALAGGHHLEPALTNPAHLKLTQPNAGPGAVGKDKKAYETKPDGNAVVVEQQLLKMNETAQDYNTVTGLYRRNINLLKLALGHNS